MFSSFARFAPRAGAILLRTAKHASFARKAALGLSFSGMSAMAVSGIAMCVEEKIPHEGVPGTQTERTFIAIKPDGVQRGLIGEIIERFEAKGFTLVGMKLLRPSEQMAAEHYDDLKSKPFFGGLVKFFSSGPIVAMVWQGQGAIKTGRKMLGETDPAASAPGSIRGDYAISIGRNICHGSDSPEGAKHEIGFWFKPDEIFPWVKENDKYIYEPSKK